MNDIIAGLHEPTGSVYKWGYNDGYMQGLEDAWECARKLLLGKVDGGFDIDTIKDIFGGVNYYDVLRELSASEVIEKLKQYEEQKKPVLSVGDVVVYKADFNNKNHVEYIVTYIFTDSLYFNAIDKEGMVYEDMEFDDSMIKTGKRYEILFTIKGESDD